MIHVSIMADRARDFTGGVSELEIEATTVRRMIAELNRLYPGLGDFVEDHAAIAIDGEIHQDALGSVLAPGAEVVLIPRIGGG